MCHPVKGRCFNLKCPALCLKYLILPDNVPLDDEIGKVPAVSEQADLARVEGGDLAPKTVDTSYCATPHTTP